MLTIFGTEKVLTAPTWELWLGSTPHLFQGEHIVTTTTHPPVIERESSSSCHAGATVPFDSISESGCYVCNWSGHLLRMPDDSITSGRSPRMSLMGCDPLYVTKISDNPFIPVTKARLIAANIDVCCNF